MYCSPAKILLYIANNSAKVWWRTVYIPTILDSCVPSTILSLHYAPAIQKNDIIIDGKKKQKMKSNNRNSKPLSNSCPCTGSWHFSFLPKTPCPRGSIWKIAPWGIISPSGLFRPHVPPFHKHLLNWFLPSSDDPCLQQFFGSYLDLSLVVSNRQLLAHQRRASFIFSEQ